MHHLPPLNALRAFEATARHLSQTKAADELNAGPGAVSYQIRALEVLLGVQLFERRVRAIALTAAGKSLYPGIQTGFLQIRDVRTASGVPATSACWWSAISRRASRIEMAGTTTYRFATAHPGNRHSHLLFAHQCRFHD